MHHLFVNPNAGQGQDADFWQSHLAAHGIDVGSRVLDDDSAIAKLGADDRVLVAGGDGTVTRVVPACIEAGCVLGVLPSGTGNDFARGLGIPLDPEAACRLIVDGTVHEVDVGTIDDRPFLNVAHVGLGSEISRDVDDDDKRWWGRLSYLRKLIEKVRRHRGFRARIACDDDIRAGRWLEIAIANGRSFGGGHEIVDATPCDGRLRVVAVRPRAAWRLLINFIRVRLLRQPSSQDVAVTLHGRRCSISRCAPLVITADGEPAGRVPAEFGVRSAALRVVLPTAP